MVHAPCLPRFSLPSFLLVAGGCDNMTSFFPREALRRTLASCIVIGVARSIKTLWNVMLSSVGVGVAVEFSAHGMCV